LITKIKYIAILLAVVVCVHATTSIYSSYSSLRITPSARECALGSTGVVAASGPVAIYYNPALSSELKSFAITINYAKWLLDTYEQSLFITRPLSYFNLGFGIVNFNAGNLEYRLDHPTEDPSGYFTPNDFNFFLNISRAVTKNNYTTQFGFSGRYYYQKISEYSATGFGVDAGLAFIISPNLKVGFSLTNFGTSMKFVREHFSLPTKFLTGIGYDVDLAKSNRSPRLKITSDLGYWLHEKKLNLNTGLEFSVQEKYFLRVGYKFNNIANNQYSAGFGVIVKKIRLEYAYNPYNLDLVCTHHFSFGVGY